MKQTLGEYFLERLEKDNESIARVYYYLFKLIKEELDDILKYPSKNFYTNKEGSWYGEFHKSMRQTDFFGNRTSFLKVDSDKSKESESITGSLDMILYNLIHADEKDFLYHFMVDVFEDYKYFSGKIKKVK